MGRARRWRRRAGPCPGRAARTGSPGRRRSGRRGPRPGRCQAPDSMAGSLAMTSSMVWPRARANRARQPHTSTTADMTRDPARPTAWAISGHTASMRSTRTLARLRRCAHHGTASTQAADQQDWRQRAVAWAEHCCRGEPCAGRADDGRGVDALGKRGQAEVLPAGDERGYGRDSERRGSSATSAGVLGAGAQAASAAVKQTASGASSERYRQAQRKMYTAAGSGSGSPGLTMVIGWRP